MDKTWRAVISGSRLFNTVFGLPRNGENIARSLGTFQSGSPSRSRYHRSSRDRTAPFFNSLLGKKFYRFPFQSAPKESSRPSLTANHQSPLNCKVSQDH